MKKVVLTVITTALTLANMPALAGSWGAQIGLLPKINDHAEPVDLRGVRGAVRYLPEKKSSHRVRVYLEGSLAQFQSDRHCHSESLTVLGLSPIVRVPVMQMAKVSPYVEFGVGGSWLSKSVFAARRLGGHWQFQDMAGLGAEFGEKNKYYMGLQVLHYSNASLAEDNRGITAPLFLTFGTRNFS